MISVAVAMLLVAEVVQADVFGTGENQFTIDFVPISGDTNPASGYGIVNHAYRMGTFEITNEQWAKFKPGADLANKVKVPVNDITWYEAAQFVNWLNTSTGHPVAYNFTGTQDTGDSAFATWATAEADGTNLYRHKGAFYYLPTEDEWFKAAFWNGTIVQDRATKAGEVLTQGDGMSGRGWNYLYNGSYATSPAGPWVVGSGSQELNGTYDMMGNVWEWMENPFNDPAYGADSTRALRGSAFNVDPLVLLPDGNPDFKLAIDNGPGGGNNNVGFRVASVPAPTIPGDANLDGIVDQADYTIWYNHYGASGATWADGDVTGDNIVDQADYTVWYNNYGSTGGNVPEPMTMALLAIGGLAMLRRRK